MRARAKASRDVERQTIGVMLDRIDPLDRRDLGERVRLAQLPSPLEPLERLTAELGGPRVWCKRDDLTGLGGGGNKLRKLEYVMGDAVRARPDVVLTGGAVQSNHARLTAAACARLGLRCELWLNRRVPDRGSAYEQTGNPLLARLFGARVQLLSGDEDADEAVIRRADQLRGRGSHPYVIPVGASTAAGACGYVDGAVELLEQAGAAGLAIDAVVVAVGSGGTLAGLSVGLAAAGWTGRLIGVAVGTRAGVLAERVRGLATEAAALVGRPGCVHDIEIDDRFIGPGYGIPTAEALDAVRRLARSEGLLLDPAYTGKAMAALIARSRAGDLRGGEHVVFVHTGGWPALFAYGDDL
jgi:L-cysteate sulfo-lyase